MNYSHQENERDTDDSFSKSLDELQELLLSQESQRDTSKLQAVKGNNHQPYPIAVDDLEDAVADIEQYFQEIGNV
ncbi:hypothetical protein H6F61_19250 [Cyanobacteria bacterium FACHB-472]|nr:hypothetical protein [Cyanobacteria bacterium FACHB-472]